MKRLTESQLQIVERTIEYLCSLSNGSKITMLQAIRCAVPEHQTEYEFLELFDLQRAIQKAVNKMDIVLDYTDHDGKLVGLSYNLDFYVWKKRLQKVQIISDLLCYGPMPTSEDPIEQHLTISFTGRIWFTEYLYGEGYGAKRQVGRKQQFSIGKGKAARILSFVADYMESAPVNARVTDVGSWELNAVKPDGTGVSVTGAMIGNVEVNGINLSEFIQSMLKVDRLAVFEHMQ